MCVAGGMGVEHPDDQRRALRIDLDAADLQTFGQPTHVEIPEGRQERRPAHLGFLRTALLGFVREVLALMAIDHKRHKSHVTVASDKA